MTLFPAASCIPGETGQKSANSYTKLYQICLLWQMAVALDAAKLVYYYIKCVTVDGWAVKMLLQLPNKFSVFVNWPAGRIHGKQIEFKFQRLELEEVGL